MKSNIWLPVLFVIVFSFTRWPGLMPLNFSAVYALAFCGGVYFPGKWKWIMPLGSILLTDLVLNSYYGVSLLTLTTIINLAVMAVLVFVGSRFNSRSSFLSLLSGGILGAVIFYLLTNTASWLSLPDYQKTLQGWFQAMTSGVPGWPPTWTFFKNTLLSGGLFTGLFAGAMKLSEAAEEKEEKEESEEAEGETAQPEQASA